MIRTSTVVNRDTLLSNKDLILGLEQQMNAAFGYNGSTDYKNVSRKLMNMLKHCFSNWGFSTFEKTQSDTSRKRKTDGTRPEGNNDVYQLVVNQDISNDISNEFLNKIWNNIIKTNTLYHFPCQIDESTDIMALRLTVMMDKLNQMLVNVSNVVDTHIQQQSNDKVIIDGDDK